MASSVSDRNPPNRGQKVDLGENAPITREAAGGVTSDSLAAESDAFSSNRGIHSENVPQKSSHQSRYDNRESAPDTGRDAATTNISKDSEQGGPAPTYVNNLYHRDPNPPHGKNLTEGFDDSSKLKDGTQLAFEAKPGSENDPARAAIGSFQVRNLTAGSRPGVSGEGNYDALNAEEGI